MKQLIEVQREYFALLSDVFRSVTGLSAASFHHHQFEDLMIVNKNITNRVLDEVSKINMFHSKNAEAFHAGARELGGVKVLLDDKRTFSHIEIRAIARLALYADTILIPDPVVSWINTPSVSLDHQQIWTLEAIWNLLKLQPLIDSKSHVATVLVLPYSGLRRTPNETHAIWNYVADETSAIRRVAHLNFQEPQSDMERISSESLATLRHEREGERRYDPLCLEACSALLNNTFSCIADVEEFAIANHDSFRQALDRRDESFFRDADYPENVDKDLQNAWFQLQETREMAMYDSVKEYDDGLIREERWYPSLQTRLLIERMRSHFRRIEQSQLLNAQPLIVSEQRSLYFRRIASFKRETMTSAGVISKKSSATIQALSDRRFTWLSSVPLNVIAEMRANKKTRSFVNALQKPRQSFPMWI